MHGQHQHHRRQGRESEEHHSEQIIGAADWIIDLEPGGGDAGGDIIAEGTPSDIRKDKNSVTGMFI